jgi:ankyrin repeat protein
MAAAALAVLLAGCASAPSENAQSSPSGSPSNSPSTSSSSAASAAPKAARTTPDPEELKRMNEQLIKAAWDNDVARARDLIRAGADVNHADDTQQSAYLIAASEGYVDLLDLTLRNGAQISATGPTSRCSTSGCRGWTAWPPVPRSPGPPRRRRGSC